MALRSLLPALLAFALSSCGGSPPSPSQQPPPNPNTITISSGGIASPRELTVAPGSRVLFVNQDGRRHDMASDDHPDHLECPAINIGPLNPGQRRETENLNVVRTCGFHDHEDPDNNQLKGRIIIR